MANTWQGEFPWQNLREDGFEGTVAGRVLPAQRLRPVRHGRQRLGVDRRLVHGPHPDRRTHAVLRRRSNPRGDVALSSSYDPASPASTSRAR